MKTYPSVPRVEINGKRHYQTPYGPAPSVTTILAETSSDEKIQVLENWRNRIGHEEAEKETYQAAALGTIMHNTLESLMTGCELYEKKNFVYQLGIKMACKIYDQSVSKMQEIWGVEVPVYYENLYAGTIDVVGLDHDGIPTVFDFKNSKMMKKREWIGEYFLQGAAYTMAHEKVMAELPAPNRVSILMCSRDLEFKKFDVQENELEEYKNEWAQKVDQYYRMVNTAIN